MPWIYFKWYVILINYNYLTRYLNPDNHEYSGYNENEVEEEYDFRLVKERGLILDSMVLCQDLVQIKMRGSAS